MNRPTLSEPSISSYSWMGIEVKTHVCTNWRYISLAGLGSPKNLILKSFTHPHSKPVYLSFLCRRQKKNANQTVLVTSDFQCTDKTSGLFWYSWYCIYRLFTSAYLLEEVRSHFRFSEVCTDGSLKNNRCSPLSSGCKIFLQSLLLKECLFWWLWIT